MALKDFTINEFLGLDTRTKDKKALKKGKASDSLNWLTGPNKDHIELRMGTALLGQTRRTGAGKITGIGIGVMDNGTQIPFFSFGRSLMYYNVATDDTTEIGTNTLPALANGEDVAFAPYANIAGNWMYASSPNSSIYKIATANPGSVMDLASTSLRGHIGIAQSRMKLWNYVVLASGFKENNTPNYSFIDHSLLSDYTQITAEVYGSGDGATKTFTHTLAQVPGGDHQTCFAVVVTDGTETFLDNKNGVLVGSLGGSGTVNYVTGAVSVTFNTAPASASNNIHVSYQYEVKTHSIADFSYDNPRTAGQGDYFPQYGGGQLQNIFSFNGVEYCMHVLKTWALTIPAADTGATNFEYRTGVGIPYWRAGLATDDAVVYVDFHDKTNPMIRQLVLNQLGTNVIPDPISEELDLTKNGLDAPIVFKFGDYYGISVQGITNGVNDPQNNFTYLYNKISQQWDKTDIPATCAETFNGQLLIGDPLSNNLLQLFSGYDDDGEIINNYHIFAETNCEIDGLKRSYRIVSDGFINPGQSLAIYAAYDHGNFVLIDTIEGWGTYVDQASGVLVGSDTVGLQAVGAGATFNAFHWRKETVHVTDIYEFVTYKVVALGVGAVQLNELTTKDNRYKGRRTIPAYQSTN